MRSSVAMDLDGLESPVALKQRAHTVQCSPVRALVAA
jgi:hypothetical protein